MRYTITQAWRYASECPPRDRFAFRSVCQRRVPGGTLVRHGGFRPVSGRPLPQTALQPALLVFGEFALRLHRLALPASPRNPDIPDGRFALAAVRPERFQFPALYRPISGSAVGHCGGHERHRRTSVRTVRRIEHVGAAAHGFDASPTRGAMQTR